MAGRASFKTRFFVCAVLVAITYRVSAADDVDTPLRPSRGAPTERAPPSHAHVLTFFGTTIFDQNPSHTSVPHPGATPAGLAVRGGKTVAEWEIVNPTMFAIPQEFDEDPGKEWKVTPVEATFTAGDQVIIQRNPALAFVDKSDLVVKTHLETITERATVRITETVQASPVTSFVTETETMVATATFIPPASTSVSTITETRTATTSITAWSTFTLVQTSLSLHPVTETVTSVSISVAQSCPIRPITLTTTVTSTSLALHVQPRETQWLMRMEIKPSNNVSPAGCGSQVSDQWTNTTISEGSPFQLEFDEPQESVLKVQDTGFRTEQYAITLDDEALLGHTSAIDADRRTWCGDEPEAALTCRIQGHSYGVFNVPAGRHTVSISLIPIQPRLTSSNGNGSPNDSSILYSVASSCSGSRRDSELAEETMTQEWTSIQINDDESFQLPPFRSTTPHQVTILDSEFRTEIYSVTLDQRILLGLTRAVDLDTTLGRSCGTSPDSSTIEDCMRLGTSAGSFVVPPGEHTIEISSAHSSRDSTLAVLSTVFYRIDEYAEPA